MNCFVTSKRPFSLHASKKLTVQHFVRSKNGNCKMVKVFFLPKRDFFKMTIAVLKVSAAHSKPKQEAQNV